MSELETMGITVHRSFVASSTEVDGVQATELTELAFTLPRPSEVHATFSKEGIGNKLVKMFKKELQTGDAAFDAAVYIRTDTPEATATLLGSAGVRDLIARIVNGGGFVELDGPFVKIEIAGRHETEDPDTVTFVRALIG